MPEFVEWMLGFPDGYTDGVSRTQRLRMLGNAVQVQCAHLVGMALAAVPPTGALQRPSPESAVACPGKLVPGSSL